MPSKIIKNWFLNRNIRFRLTALFVMIFGSVLILFSSLIYSSFVRGHREQFDVALFNHAVDVSKSIKMNFFGEFSFDPDAQQTGGKIFPFSLGKIFIQVVGPGGQVLAHTYTLDKGALPLTPDDLKAVSVRGIIFKTLSYQQIPSSYRTSDTSYRLLSYFVRTSFNQGLVLQIAAPMTFLEQASGGLRRLLLFGVPISLLLSAFGGLYISKRALAPVSAIIDQTKSLDANRLSDRIALPLAHDEIWELTRTLNELLNRLQGAFESQERFIADASHELKTPLAIMRGELDSILSKNRDPKEISDFLSSASQELNYLSRIVEDLLILARMDVGNQALSLQQGRIDETVIDVISRLKAVAEPKKIKIHFDLIGDGNFLVLGDFDLLKSMMKNFVENAIKFSPADSRVDVIIEDSNNQVQIKVRDQGPGIPEHLISQIFERFYRLPGSDTKISGAGLGLAIAKRIIQAHGGQVEVKSKLGSGTIFIVNLPKPV